MKSYSKKKSLMKKVAVVALGLIGATIVASFVAVLAFSI